MRGECSCTRPSEVAQPARRVQVVRKALDEGYEVRCTVRPRQNPADFLRDWGATTVQVQPVQIGDIA